MPTSPLRPCVVPRCPDFAGPHGRCLKHAQAYEQQRPNYVDRRRYRQTRWRGPHGLREQVLREQQHRCAICGLITTELDIDHIIKPGQDEQMFYKRSNLQALCKSCHSAKTAGGL